jgi:hypothetical protein
MRVEKMSKRIVDIYDNERGCIYHDPKDGRISIEGSFPTFKEFVRMVVEIAEDEFISTNNSDVARVFTPTASFTDELNTNDVLKSFEKEFNLEESVTKSIKEAEIVEETALVPYVEAPIVTTLKQDEDENIVTVQGKKYVVIGEKLFALPEDNRNSSGHSDGMIKVNPGVIESVVVDGKEIAVSEKVQNMMKNNTFIITNPEHTGYPAFLQGKVEKRGNF